METRAQKHLEKCGGLIFEPHECDSVASHRDRRCKVRSPAWVRGCSPHLMNEIPAPCRGGAGSRAQQALTHSTVLFCLQQ